MCGLKFINENSEPCDRLVLLFKVSVPILPAVITKLRYNVTYTSESPLHFL